MKVVWISPRPVSGLYCNTVYESGSWIDATYRTCRDCPVMEFHIISFGNVMDVQEYRDGRHKGYVLPFDNKERHLTRLRDIINPDVVQIWGSEHWYSLFAANIFANIPKIVFIQGVSYNLAKNYFAGIPTSKRIKYITARDIYYRAWLDAQQHKMWKSARLEREVLRKCQAAIIENDWCEDQIRVIAPECRTFRSLLPIKEVFFQEDWNIDKIERHSIFTNAGGYPIKGHHTLLEALHFVVQKYPDTKLYIPGFSHMKSGFNNWIKRSSYENLLVSYVRKYNLQNNICNLGTLDSNQMARQIAKCNVYTMPSWVENHSSSLIEAMIVGAPCVSAYAGGVSTLTHNGFDALTYNPQDSECLAGNIIRIFEQDNLAMQLSDNAKLIRPLRKATSANDYVAIYNEVMNNEHR